MIAIFAAADYSVSRAEVSDWLRKEADPSYQKCTDKTLAIFLNGLINEKRGKKEGPQPEPETRLTNNIIFMKLKIALNLKADDILAILLKADFRLSKHELSAFFRRPGHKHYRECKEQILRNFLHGLQIVHRTESTDEVGGEVPEEVPEELDDVEVKSEVKSRAKDKVEPESVWSRNTRKKS